MREIKKEIPEILELETEVINPPRLSPDEIAAFREFAINRFSPEDCFYIPTKKVPPGVEVFCNLGTTQLKDPVEFYRQWLIKTSESFADFLPDFSDFVNRQVEEFASQGVLALEPASRFGIVMTEEDPNEVDPKDFRLLTVSAIPEESEMILVRHRARANDIA